MEYFNEGTIGLEKKACPTGLVSLFLVIWYLTQLKPSNKSKMFFLGLTSEMRNF